VVDAKPRPALAVRLPTNRYAATTPHRCRRRGRRRGPSARDGQTAAPRSSRSRRRRRRDSSVRLGPVRESGVLRGFCGGLAGRIKFRRIRVRKQVRSFHGACPKELVGDPYTFCDGTTGDRIAGGSFRGFSRLEITDKRPVCYHFTPSGLTTLPPDAQLELGQRAIPFGKLAAAAAPARRPTARQCFLECS
jgi:hypothetical protein